MKGIAPKQKQICDFVLKYKSENDGNSPSFTEVAEELGVAAATVAQAVLFMSQKGLMSYTPGKTRSIKVNKEVYDSLTKEE